ncbi:MAG: hypothetical protein ACOCTR_04000 [Candidatus Natronoplasma sp.]
MHTNVKKIYAVVGSILALIWILLLTGIVRFGWVRFFLLVIITTVVMMSIFTEPRSSGGGRSETIFTGP